jgi:hypothetical protein
LIEKLTGEAVPVEKLSGDKSPAKSTNLQSRAVTPQTGQRNTTKADAGDESIGDQNAAQGAKHRTRSKSRPPKGGSSNTSRPPQSGFTKASRNQRKGRTRVAGAR